MKRKTALEEFALFQTLRFLKEGPRTYNQYLQALNRQGGYFLRHAKIAADERIRDGWIELFVDGGRNRVRLTAKGEKFVGPKTPARQKQPDGIFSGVVRDLNSEIKKKLRAKRYGKNKKPGDDHG